MKRSLALICLAATAWMAGCQADENARAIVAWNTDPGRTELKMAPKAESLIQSGQITANPRIEMPDKTVMDVWVIKARAAQSKGTMLILHQLEKSKASFPYRGMGERLAQKGYDVVLPDLRHHGYSGGDFITYGAKEKNDLKVIMDKLVSEKLVSPNIYAFGQNLGGMVAIQYAAIDPRVRGVMAVAPYKDLRNFAKYWLSVRVLTDKDLDDVLAACGKIGDFDPADASAVEAVRKVHCPIVLIGGRLDPSVPIEQVQAIYDAANEPKKFVVLGPEQFVFQTLLVEDWLADKMDALAKEGVSGVTTKPAAAAAKNVP